MHVRPDHTLTLESAWKYAPGWHFEDKESMLPDLFASRAIQAIEENANFAWSQNFGHKNATWMHTDRRSTGCHAASRNLTIYWSLREEECHGDIKT